MLKLKYFYILFFITTVLPGFCEPVKVMDNFKITAAFGDSRDDHLHTGIDLAAVDEDVKSIMDSELIFYNRQNPRSITYGNGNFMILENSEKKLRFNYSHLRDGSIDYRKIIYKQSEKIGSSGNSGHSTGYHLHLEVEDIKNNKLLNPLQFIQYNDNMPPRIDDVYFISSDNQKMSLWEYNRIKRGGKLFIKCIDRIDSSNYDLVPYSVRVIIDGKEKFFMTFDYFEKGESSYTVSNTGLKFGDIYKNKDNTDLYLLDYSSLPDLIGLKIIVTDFTGRKAEFKKEITILSPDIEKTTLPGEKK
jgi:hypothetical protein